MYVGSKLPNSYKIQDDYFYVNGEKICKIEDFELTGKDKSELILHIKLNGNEVSISGRASSK